MKELVPDSTAQQASWQAASHAARTAYGRLVARLCARGSDLASAQDALSDALLSALQSWPEQGVPIQPEAWLWTAAKRRYLDSKRHDKVVHAYALREAKARLGQSPWSSPGGESTGMETEPDRNNPAERAVDERLGLLFLCAHPVVPARDRSPLILQAFLGLTSDALALHFLVKPASMAQRMVRAKARIRQEGLRFALPERAAWRERLDAGLDALYACYTHAWIGEGGTRGVRVSLADEVLWLVHWLCRRLPNEAEVWALSALLHYLEARQAAHRMDSGYVPLSEQDTALWDKEHLTRADQALGHAARLFQADGAALPGRYQLEAAIQGAQCHGRLDGKLDYPYILQCYEALVAHSPGIGVHCAMAAARAASGAPKHALSALDALPEKDRLVYQPWWAARADALERLGRWPEASQAWQGAMERSSDPAQARWLSKRLQASRGMHEAGRHE